MTLFSSLLLVAAQSVTGGTIDLSQLPSKAETAAARDVAAAAQATALAAQAAAAAACQPMAQVPATETVAGAAGSGSMCRLVNAVQPRITRAKIVTTVTGGTAPVTWEALPSVPIVIPIPMISAGALQAPACFPVEGSVTTTGATIKCFTTQSVAVAVLGAVVAPVTTAAAGVTVEVFAIPTTP